MKKSEVYTFRMKHQKGIALVMALIITLVVFLLVMSTLYMVNTSTIISGAGKRYASAAEAADGAVDVMKESIMLIRRGDPISNMPFSDTSGLALAVFQSYTPTTVTLDLSGTGLLTTYQAKITIQKIGEKALIGTRIEFGRAGTGGGGGGSAVYYKINVVVTGPNNTKAETDALYRHV